MNHDLIGFLGICIGLFLVCAPFVWAQRRDEAARRDRLRECGGRYPSQRIDIFPEYADAMDLANEGRAMSVLDHAELTALVTSADLPKDFRC